MDPLEYQGKQLFRRHGVPVSDGQHAGVGAAGGRNPTQVAEIAGAILGARV